MVGFSSFKISFLPPKDLWIASTPMIKSSNSEGSIDTAISGPGHFLLEVKCFSIIEAPKAAAAKDV
jgi:hypothetical protein